VRSRQDCLVWSLSHATVSKKTRTPLSFASGNPDRLLRQHQLPDFAGDVVAHRA
jgi:hypothetical protein